MPESEIDDAVKEPKLFSITEVCRLTRESFWTGILFGMFAGAFSLLFVATFFLGKPR